MITTANYLLIANIGTEQYTFEYEDKGDVLDVLNEFYGDDYPDLIELDGSGAFPIDIFAMDGNKVIATHKLAFFSVCFDHYFGKGWIASGPYTPEIFMQHLKETRKELDDKKPFRNDVTSFMFYMWNHWSKEECKAVFASASGGWEHYWNKWCYFSEKYSRFGAVEEFYAELSNYNRDKLVKRALELYDGTSRKL
jgi:hypothetical protein